MRTAMARRLDGTVCPRKYPVVYPKFLRRSRRPQEGVSQPINSPRGPLYGLPALSVLSLRRPLGSIIIDLSLKPTMIRQNRWMSFSRMFRYGGWDTMTITLLSKARREP